MTRVLQWATGVTGTLSLRHVLARPDLELVGVRVYDPGKSGQDAGALCGGPAIGIAATDDRDEILRTEADVVLYVGKVEIDLAGCFTDVCDLLASGKNVVATGSRFVHPRSVDENLAANVERACCEGGSTFLGLGLFPGFVGESLAPVLARLTQRTDRIDIREVLDYSTYASRDLIFSAMGFGRHPQDTSPLLADTDYAVAAWLGSATVLAESLGLTILGVEGFREVATTPRPLSVAAGDIAAGTVGAMRFGVIVDCGDTTVTVEHLTRMADDLAPEWPSTIGYEVCFGGEPDVRAHLVIGADGHDHATQGCLATAAHAVNAIPVVLAAPPGLVDLSAVGAFDSWRRTGGRQLDSGHSRI